MICLKHTRHKGSGRLAGVALAIAVLSFGVNSAYGQGQHAGVLSESDGTLTSGEYSDSYTLSANVGDWISVVMTSKGFDPYVILKPPSCPQSGTCEEQYDNDDMQSGNETAIIVVRVDEPGTWTVLATSSAPGETGPYEVTIAVDDMLSSVGEVAPLILSFGGVRREEGGLEEGDKTLNSGEYVDNYSFVGRAGQSVVIDMTSSEFDPYLILFMPDKTQEDNDDWEGSSERSRLEVILPLDGMYRISATSFAPDETGQYVLEIRDKDPFIKG